MPAGLELAPILWSAGTAAAAAYGAARATEGNYDTIGLYGALALFGLAGSIFAWLAWPAPVAAGDLAPGLTKFANGIVHGCVVAAAALTGWRAARHTLT